VEFLQQTFFDTLKLTPPLGRLSGINEEMNYFIADYTDVSKIHVVACMN
jgi:hypothetical protein